MSWIRLDDQIAHHPKFLHAGAEASWFWVTCLGYAQKYLTDGFIHNECIATIGAFKDPHKLVDVLVRSRLLDKVKDGYQVHDYLDFNEPAIRVKQRRAADRHRKNPDKSVGNSSRNPGGIQPESGRNPGGIHLESSRNPGGIRAESSRNPAGSRARPRVGVGTGGRGRAPAPHPIPSHPKKEQEQNIKAVAAPPRRKSGKPPPENPQANVSVITKLAHEIMQTEPDEANWPEALKSACAKRKIAYTAEVVYKALDSAKVQKTFARRK